MNLQDDLSLCWSHRPYCKFLCAGSIYDFLVVPKFFHNISLCEMRKEEKIRGRERDKADILASLIT